MKGRRQVFESGPPTRVMMQRSCTFGAWRVPTSQVISVSQPGKFNKVSGFLPSTLNLVYTVHSFSTTSKRMSWGKTHWKYLSSNELLLDHHNAFTFKNGGSKTCGFQVVLASKHCEYGPFRMLLVSSQVEFFVCAVGKNLGQSIYMSLSELRNYDILSG